jgi:hypothetical protein
VAESRHRAFQLAEAAFQLGIVLSSISIVARSGWLLGVGGAFGVVGLLLAANAVWLVLPPA